MQQVVDFVLELDRLKGVSRKVKPTGLDRYENSAEHSWQIALLAASLAPYADPGVDMNRVIAMLLVHDIGEIDAGDVIAFAEHDWKAQKRAELAAVERIFGILPDDQRDWFLSLWREFDEERTPESKFANAADRAMPVLLNLANEGQSWRENGISYERVVRRIKAQINDGCPALWEYLEPRLEDARQRGWFGG